MEENQDLETLKNFLQKEIYMMRELLANMYKEELSIQCQDKGGWEQVMLERAHMLARLGTIRQERLSATAEFEKKKEITELDTIELFSLRDQLFALAERMNFIQSRNTYLSEHLPFKEGGVSHYPRSLPHMERPKRKSSVATYPPKK